MALGFWETVGWLYVGISALLIFAVFGIIDIRQLLGIDLNLLRWNGEGGAPLAPALLSCDKFRL